MAPSPVADLQGQTAPCSQAALEDEFAESALHVKGKEGVCLLCGALVLQTHHLLWPSEILLHDGAHQQPLRAFLGLPRGLAACVQGQLRFSVAV